ncbi:MAG: 2-deoxy-D-gluconate 3-dehydrogenase [Firmicutes bacterium]|nr:2-deoxy-D-gluconate 3-dehydrogenase [Bacillota bacterium]
MNLFNLEGKVAIVTGGTKGLGQGMALALAGAGADIVSVATSDYSETEQKVKALGRQFLGIKANLGSLDPIAGIIEQAVAKFGHIDILVNNSGIIRRNESLEFTEKDWDDVMNINLKSMFFLSQAVAKQFVKQGNGGKIINIASMLSFQGGIRVPSYTSSKSGVMGLTKILANEWAKYNVNVNAIAPGYMATDNTEALRADEVRNAEILGRIPAGRWGKPSDLGGPVIFLSSEAANYVQGYTIAVDGGWLAR